MRPHYLTALFKPSAIAMFGASDTRNSVGQVVFNNLLSAGFEGKIYAINPGHRKVQGKNAYDSIGKITDHIDLAVVATPAKTLPKIVEECGEHGVKSIIVLSAGFREIGPAGERLEQQVMDIARSYGIRILGPNCLGLMCPDSGLNATFGKTMAKPGNLALVSQSGAICTAVLDWADQNNIGFSTVVSMGVSADIDFGDILDYLVTDPQTDSILLYIEGVHNARRFMSGLRAAARIKPVIAIKVGRHNEGAQASMSHTGALVGDDDAFSAALARSGVVRIRAISQLCAGARTLSSRYRGCGNRVIIITNGGGPGVLAADHAADLGLELAELSNESMQKLNGVLPTTWSHGNPVDIIGDATPQRYKQAVEICLEDKSVDGAVIILTPQAMTEPHKVADALIGLSKNYKKPVLTTWMGGTQVESSRVAFTEAGIPSYPTPETTIDAFRFLSDYQANQKLLLQTPSRTSRRHTPPNISAAKLIIESVLAEKRKILTEPESFAILEAFNIPAARHGIAHSPEEALIIATSIGFPVVMKIYSSDITHKTDVGGVRLNIGSGEGVRSTYRELMESVGKSRPDANIEGVVVEKMYRSPNARELMIGIKQDPVFGPVISFGSGGVAVEVHNDAAVSLPPLNRCLAQDLINRTRVAKMLGEFRRMPAIDSEALIDVLLRVSSMACELPWLEEMDINPLIVDEHGAIAIDARMQVHFPRISTDPYQHMAIHPYPAHLVEQVQLPSGANITIRPIRPEDADLEADFVKRLSDEAKYFRFMRGIHELTPEMLVRFTQIDYDQEMAMIAVTVENGEEMELGVARYIINPDTVSCEFALVVADGWQRQGLGHRLMEQLIEVARDRGLQIIEGEVLSNNTKMLKLMSSLGFRVSTDPDDFSVKLVSKML